MELRPAPSRLRRTVWKRSAGPRLATGEFDGNGVHRELPRRSGRQRSQAEDKDERVHTHFQFAGLIRAA